MTFRVIIQPRAAEDLKTAAAWIARDSPQRAALWLESVASAITGLRSFPNRCPLAPENEAFDVEIRQLMHGQYRILFTVDPAANEVVILHVRHGARRSMDAEDLP